ncbi:hypothetical protein PIB30_064692, partial [Stylosanthes scabra]|nr:hypothetical protein [Stylosanthes scabra]
KLGAKIRIELKLDHRPPFMHAATMFINLRSFYSGAIVVSDFRRLQQLLQEVRSSTFVPSPHQRRCHCRPSTPVPSWLVISAVFSNFFKGFFFVKSFFFIRNVLHQSFIRVSSPSYFFDML